MGPRQPALCAPRQGAHRPHRDREVLGLGRRRAEYVDRALFTVVDGYDPPKMMAGIAWCWKPYLQAAADFLTVSAFTPAPASYPNSNSNLTQLE